MMADKTRSRQAAPGVKAAAAVALFTVLGVFAVIGLAGFGWDRAAGAGLLTAAFFLMQYSLIKRAFRVGAPEPEERP